ncbi:hypothetical protein C5748_04695 [Phyllobacterium phragmitis]|uniref:Organic solvent tolerance-like N-terminal domain-containing protein n=1 Tax=Phyllobacterium phragmitis TaxID=2670329 RepID=A0A2S9IVZ5_9HYPH|nr:hypothetical protein C5748_04695 [Phyllobacterium phragmitis]
MHRLAIVATTSLLALGSTALAANSQFGSVKIKADTIKVDSKNLTHASGNVVVLSGKATIKMDKASISKKDGKIVIEAEH